MAPIKTANLSTCKPARLLWCHPSSWTHRVFSFFLENLRVWPRIASINKISLGRVPRSYRNVSHVLHRNYQILREKVENFLIRSWNIRSVGRKLATSSIWSCTATPSKIASVRNQRINFSARMLCETARHTHYFSMQLITQKHIHKSDRLPVFGEPGRYSTTSAVQIKRLNSVRCRFLGRIVRVLNGRAIRCRIGTKTEAVSLVLRNEALFLHWRFCVLG